jgi:hypothetical protein
LIPVVLSQTVLMNIVAPIQAITELDYDFVGALKASEATSGGEGELQHITEVHRKPESSGVKYIKLFFLARLRCQVQERQARLTFFYRAV